MAGIQNRRVAAQKHATQRRVEAGIESGRIECRFGPDA
jgi:hypothetical protein